MAESLTRGRLARLAQQLAQERLLARRIALACLADAERFQTAQSPDELRGLLAVIALALHHWYSALESMLERVERTFETLPTGPRSCRALTSIR